MAAEREAGDVQLLVLVRVSELGWHPGLVGHPGPFSVGCRRVGHPPLLRRSLRGNPYTLHPTPCTLHLMA